jgi:AbrB family looped-hinge helix DNA binding protein
METITLSSKGQIVIPKQLRTSANLLVGDELSIHYVGGEIRLRPLVNRSAMALAQVAGCLARSGETSFKSEDEVKTAIKNRLKLKNSVKVGV